jgi:hypothetical protein
MDGSRFDQIARALADVQDRRSLLRKVAGAASAALVAAVGLNESGEAASICRTGGAICRKNQECCSGTCGPTDATGRQRCTCTTQQLQACQSSGGVLQPPGTVLCCAGTCLPNNVSNCGSCGTSCAANESCCKPAFSPVGSTARICVDLKTSESNCGACGTRCAPTCDFDGNSLTGGQICCNGTCVANDVNNCNTCGDPCPADTFDHATVTCVAACTNSVGGCLFQCEAGFEDCNEDVTDGCETAVPPLSDASCGLDLCGRTACPPDTFCTPCGIYGAGTCCPAGYVCGANASGQCGGCVPDSPDASVCSYNPSRPGRFLR